MDPDPNLNRLYFSLGERRYSLLARYVTHVERTTTLTAIPGVPAHIRGVMMHQRRALAVVDLSTFLGQPTSIAEHLLLVRHEELEAGILVSQVHGVLEGDAEELDIMKILEEASI